MQVAARHGVGDGMDPADLWLAGGEEIKFTGQPGEAQLELRLWHIPRGNPEQYFIRLLPVLHPCGGPVRMAKVGRHGGMDNNCRSQKFDERRREGEKERVREGERERGELRRRPRSSARQRRRQ